MNSRSVLLSFLPLFCLLVTACTGPGPNPTGSRPPTSAAAVSPKHERIEAIAACLRERGWTVEVDLEEGSVGGSIPQDQYSAWTNDREQCQKLHARDEQPPESRDDPRWRAEYEFQQQTQECLRKEGYDGPPAPSLDTFIEQHLAGSPEAWTAWRSVPKLPQDEWRRLNKACPQTREG